MRKCWVLFIPRRKEAGIQNDDNRAEGWMGPCLHRDDVVGRLWYGTREVACGDVRWDVFGEKKDPAISTQKVQRQSEKMYLHVRVRGGASVPVLKGLCSMVAAWPVSMRSP